MTDDATATYGFSNSNRTLFDELRGVTDSMNTRQIVCLSPPDAKDPTTPRGGIAPSTSAAAGQFFDPWGTPYKVRMDWDYDNQVANPYATNAGNAPLLRSGVISWSLGKDRQSQTSAATPADKKAGTNNDDVISWQ